MGKLDLRVRDLNSGVSSLVSFDSEEAATAWLVARPKFIEVLGVATLGLDNDANNRLKASLRPLDPEEKLLERRLEAAIDAVTREREEEKNRREREASEAHRVALRSADPNRMMEVHWTFNADMTLVDLADERKIPDEAREAVVAWVRERDEWVKDRNQVVGDAKVMVWPGPVPAGEERVKRGTFIPVTAAAPKEATAGDDKAPEKG
jgi:hypothetical protein